MKDTSPSPHPGTGAPFDGNVILIDDMPFRRAQLKAFLQTWSDQVHLPVIGIDAAQVTSVDTAIMLILSLGTALVGKPQASLLEEIKTRLPDVPIVVLAESVDTANIQAAFELGVRGYIPSSSEPNVALSALTFVLEGGHYFPPGTLMNESA